MQRLLIVSGRSGSGKTSALHILEDLSYLCIDNLPLSLLPDIVERLLLQNDVKKLAVGIDIRSQKLDLENFDSIMRQVNTIITPEILFLTAQDEQIIARFSATRRKHPLLDVHHSLSDALNAESKRLKTIAVNATITIDTSKLNIHELKERIKIKLGQDSRLLVLFQSFGFKHGIPLDADYVFDVRMLPNPHWQLSLRGLSGRDKAVQDFLEQDADVKNMRADLQRFFENWLPSFSSTNRNSISIAIGCTGGQHRSVFMVESLAQAFAKDWQVQILHRERKHWEKAKTLEMPSIILDNPK